MSHRLFSALDFLGFVSRSMRVSHWIGMGEYDVVIEYLKDTPPPGPDATYAHSILALCYHAKRDPESAFFHATHVLLQNPYDSFSLKIAADFYLQLKQYNHVRPLVVRYLHVPEEEVMVPGWLLRALRLAGLSRLADRMEVSLAASAEVKRQYFDWAVAFLDWYERCKPQPPPILQ